MILLFVPETKALTLEELDQVFSVPTSKHMSYQLRNGLWHFRVWVLRQKLEPLPPFYRKADTMSGHQTTEQKGDLEDEEKGNFEDGGTRNSDEE